MQLFTEIFPISPIPVLSAYTLRLYEDQTPTPRLGRLTAQQLQHRLGGSWLWDARRLLTTPDPDVMALIMALEGLREEDPDLLGWIESIEADLAWTATPTEIADFVIRACLPVHEAAFNAALQKFQVELKGGMRIERAYKATAWTILGQPCLAFAPTARVICDQTAQQFVDHKGDPKVLIGLRVSDKTGSFTGEIVKIIGTVGERREALLKQARKEALQRLITQAPDEEIALRVQSGDKKYDYPARALELLVRPNDFALFGLDPKVIDPILRPDPFTRSQMVKALSEVAKNAQLVGKAFNAKENKELFRSPEFEPYLRFAKNRSRPFVPSKMAYDFVQCGAYHLRAAFRDQAIRVCVVNALPMKIEDFIEAMQRQLGRNFDFKIEVVRERKVRVVSLSNLEGAVKAIEKDTPDMILAFIPDEHQDSPENYPAYVKSLTLGRGIPAEVIFESTLDDPESMPAIIMGILAKTGNTPFALADPLDFADFVVGLDLIDDESTMTAIARVYRASGEFVRYAVRSTPIATNTPPFVLLRDLFPQRDFANKRVVIHYDGRIPDQVRQALSLWGQALQAAFYPVEIVRRGAPRLYALEGGKIIAPSWGAYFRLSPQEAFVILSAEDGEPGAQGHTPTPQPVQVIASGITIEQAIRSLQLWTLLYYIAGERQRIPVTTYNAGELAYWLRKGGTFVSAEGEVPFWL
ncbi:MAG: hypothetical protein MUF87_17005 [Anaerolineae bacterium]|nr:hypothetical protein [Anaerolineae bacterium]